MLKKLILCLVALNPLLAQADHPEKLLQFMTSQDHLKDSVSNITLTNTAGSIENVTGLYLQNLWHATGGTCGAAFDTATNTTVYNSGYGMMFQTVSFSNNQTAVVGANFLYNMIVQYMAIAHLQDGITNSTPGASPGTWCIQLGITSTFTTLPPLPCNPADNTYTCLPILLSSDAVNQIAVTCTDSSPTGSAGACVKTGGISINQNFPDLS